ncbi:XRE family transcriptional regulator [Bacillus velezensis]|uniref:XRE family transcriptional regulator n=1 Tax=Bacillus velezensis TaxID=492670 RepID=UPI003000009C
MLNIEERYLLHMQLTKQRKMKIKEIAASVYRTPSLISRYFNGKCNVSAEVENALINLNKDTTGI